MPKIIKQLDSNGFDKIIPLSNPSTVEPRAFAIESRRVPIRSIILEGKDFEKIFLDDFVTSIDIEINSRGMSFCEIVLHNVDQNLLTNQAVFRHHNKISVFLGYEDTGLKRIGDFRINVPRKNFSSSNASTVVLECVSEDYDLCSTEERKVYLNKKDSDIVKSIAVKNGLNFDIDDTGFVNPQVTQANESDMQFIMRRAEIHGFEFYVEDRRLHFHRQRYEHSEVRVFFNDGERSMINSFEVCADPWYKGTKWVATKIDPITKEEYRVESSDTKLDPLQKDLAKNNKGTIGPETFSQGNGVKRPTRYLVGEGHWQDRTEAEKQVNYFSQSNRYGVLGCGKIDVGIENLQARKIMTIFGVGRFTGDYYITKVRHNFCAASGYNVEFEVKRVGVSQSLDPPIRDVFSGFSGATITDKVVIQSAGIQFQR